MMATGLNLDVLFVIVSYSDWSTLLTLMLTSHQLNREAAKFILKDRRLEAMIEIDGLGEQRAKSFVSFVRAGGGRSRYLRSLAIGGTKLSSEVSEGFSDIICQATNLKRLRLTNAERSLDNHPNILVALASIHTIEELYVSRPGMLMYQLLDSAHWPLQYAEVVHGGANIGMNPIDLIRPIVCPTLEELVLQKWPYRIPSFPFPNSPRLKRLVLARSKAPTIASWAKLFPKVKELVARLPLSPNSPHPTRGPPAPPYVLRACDRRVHDHNAMENRHSATHPTWPFLHACYVPNLLQAYLLALPCPVRTLVIDSMEHWSTRMFKDVMKRARPKELRIGGAYPEELIGHLRVGLECAGDSLQELRRLSVYILEAENVPDDRPDIFATLVCLQAATIVM